MTDIVERLRALNQQQDVFCTECGWRGARHKIMDRPCPKCGGRVVQGSDR